MTETLVEILSPSFLLFPAVLGSVVLGLVCPVVGGFLVLRRSVLLGLTLPQVAASGVACAFLLHQLGWMHQLGLTGPEHHVSELHRVLAYAGSLLFTFAAMALLGFLDKRSTGRSETRLAVAYALAGSLTILFVVFNPFGDVAILSLIKGEVVILSFEELTTLAATYAAVLAGIVVFRRELVLSSFDRELTFLLRGGTARWDILLYLLAGVTISLGVIMAGPLLIFGFLVLPPIAARPLVSRMAPYFLISVLLGILTALVGFVLAYRLDLPLGPTDVALGCGAVLLTHVLAWLKPRLRRAAMLSLLILGTAGMGACSLHSLERSLTGTPSTAPFPTTASIRSSPLWLAPVKNSTGKSLLLPSTNPIDSVREMTGKRSPAERDSVMTLLRASMNLQLSKRDISVSEPESLDERLSRFPGAMENVVQTARRAGMSGNVLVTDIKRWSPTKQFVSVLIDLRLIDVRAGRIIWEERIQGAIATPSAVSLRDGYVDAVERIVEDMFPST